LRKRIVCCHAHAAQPTVSIPAFRTFLFTRRANSNVILLMLRIPNRQNLLPLLYHTEFSVQKIPTCELLHPNHFGYLDGDYSGYLDGFEYPVLYFLISPVL